jgi:nitroreductase
MDALKAISTRRSIRTFTPDPVSDADLDTLLRAAMAAPSASNEHPWRFVVARDRAMLGRLSKATPFAGPLAGAPVGIVVCADQKVLRHKGFWVIDCAAAIENLLVAARAMGLGGVWIGVHPAAPLSAAVRLVAGLPRHIKPHSLVALGHPAEERPPVDRFDADYIHAERW